MVVISLMLAALIITSEGMAGLFNLENPGWTEHCCGCVFLFVA